MGFLQPVKTRAKKSKNTHAVELHTALNFDYIKIKKNKKADKEKKAYIKIQCTMLF